MRSKYLPYSYSLLLFIADVFLTLLTILSLFSKKAQAMCDKIEKGIGKGRIGCQYL